MDLYHLIKMNFLISLYTHIVHNPLLYYAIVFLEHLYPKLLQAKKYFVEHIVLTN